MWAILFALWQDQSSQFSLLMVAYSDFQVPHLFSKVPWYLIQLVTNSPIHFIAHSPSWGADCHSDSQEIPRLIQNLNVYYHAYKSLTMGPILRQMNLVYTFMRYFYKIHLNIILTSISRFANGFLPSRCPFGTNHHQCCHPNVCQLLWSVLFLCCYCYRLRTPTPPPPEDVPSGVEGADSDSEIVRDTYKMPPPIPLPGDSRKKLRVPSPVPQPKDETTDQVSSVQI